MKTPSYTPEKLAAMTLEQRETLYRNCLRLEGNADATSIVEMLVASGLSFRKSREIAHGDPEMTAIEIIVNTPENEPTMLDAVARGEPPLAVIEPLIVARLGTDYRGDNGGTVAAGYLIAKRLYALGHEKQPSRPMPPGSVAKTAATYRKKPGSR
jgi:hypothetical protein